MKKNIKTIVTHDGQFHADDILGYILCKKYFKEFNFVRTRDTQIIQEAFLVFDVGGGSFDHHGQGSQEYRANEIPYSSAGLLWKEFGKDILREYYNIPERDIQKLYLRIDKKFIQGIDAVDNGFSVDQNVNVYNIVQIVKSFNRKWYSNENEDIFFEKAATVVELLFDEYIEDQKASIMAYDYVVSAFETREHKEILELEIGVPWKDALFNIDVDREILFVIFPDPISGFRIQTIPEFNGSRKIRKEFPKSWRGLKGFNFNKKVGLEDGIFCHNTGYIAGAKSKRSIMKLAEMAISA